MSVITGIVQMASGSDKEENLRKATSMVGHAVDSGAELVVLPELFGFLPPKIDRGAYLENAEGIDGPTIGALSRIARQKRIHIIAGSIIEREGNDLFNTCCFVTPDGLKGKYRKSHLFMYGKINEGQVFKEGNRAETVSCKGFRIGLTICFDLRFPEVYRLEALSGADAIVNVAAFLEETGRAHWMPLVRARAIENQAYLIAANQAQGGPSGKYYGHSCIVDPWGRVIARAGPDEAVITGEIRKEKIREVRERLPLLGMINKNIRAQQKEEE